MILSLLFFLMLHQGADSAVPQALPFERRILQVKQFLEKLETRSIPDAPEDASGQVLIIFWTSERGRVISSRATGGSADAQGRAIETVHQWKFKPSSAGGQPLQVISAVIVDFSQRPPTIREPEPMSAFQLTPGFQLKCSEGLIHLDISAEAVCKQQLSDVENDPASTAINRFTALDKYGLALLELAHQPNEAVEAFSKAIDRALEILQPSDAEWGYLHWHRAVAERQLGNNADADADFDVAEKSLRDAEQAVGKEKIAVYYHSLLERLAHDKASR